MSPNHVISTLCEYLQADVILNMPSGSNFYFQKVCIKMTIQEE